jgi:hypothetical protein
LKTTKNPKKCRKNLRTNELKKLKKETFQKVHKIERNEADDGGLVLYSTCPRRCGYALVHMRRVKWKLERELGLQVARFGYSFLYI